MVGLARGASRALGLPGYWPAIVGAAIQGAGDILHVIERRTS
jgi:hypothetical protein